MSGPKRNDGGLAFPQALSVEQEFIGSDGMSLRDYFAAKALPAVYAASIARGDELQESIACEAYELADAMIEARDKGRA